MTHACPLLTRTQCTGLSDSCRRHTVTLVGASVPLARRTDSLTTYDPATDCTTETYAYDLLGNRVATTDALGNTIFKSYDPLGNLTAEWGATYPVRYTYDTQGRRTSLTTFRTTGAVALVATDGDTTTWTYDPYTGNCLSKTYADGSTITYTHTPDNLPLRTTYASGKWKQPDFRRSDEAAYSGGLWYTVRQRGISTMKNRIHGP